MTTTAERAQPRARRKCWLAAWQFLLHGLHGVLESALARGEPATRTLARLDPVVTALLGR
ncbi:hypothetical protein [Asanoa sp. NPDC050611]|uniref:hypothetical protein n=1 Tax=Asanoa sp. NPDC050611 TaxID=3157098 RepID=UPI0033E82AF1